MIDTLCKEAVEGNAAVACFYFEFAAQAQSPAAVLSSVLKQVVRRLDEIPERIVKAFQDRGMAIGVQMLALSQIVQFLQDISSSRSTFICIDALDECPPGHRIKLLNSLNQNSPEVLRRSGIYDGEAAYPGWGWGASRGKGRDKIYNTRQEWHHYTPPSETERGYHAGCDGRGFRAGKHPEHSQNGFGNVRKNINYYKYLMLVLSDPKSRFLLALLSIETILQETTIFSWRQRLGAIGGFSFSWFCKGRTRVREVGWSPSRTLGRQRGFS